MIISRSHANRLVKAGKATKDGSTHQDGKRYQIVIRHDLQRVDHYELHQGQFTVVQVKYMPASKPIIARPYHGEEN